MRILCVIENLGSGGAQRQMMELALGFKKIGHDVSFLTYRPESFFSKILINMGISINLIISRNYLIRLLKMRKFIRKGNYDSVVSFLEASNFICEIAGFPSRKWNLIVGERSANPKILKSFRLIFYRWFHLSADYIVANSYSNIQMVKSVNPFLSLSKCKIIYNIVNFEQWSPSETYIPRKNGKLKLVIAASHQKLKNSHGLVEALALLNENEREMLEVEWYGDRVEPPYFDDSFPEVINKVNKYKLNKVISFYPATINLNLKMQEADVIGLFSFYEGFPNIICEGMACGKTVICSQISDIPNLLSYNSNLMFNPKDIETIRKTLNYIIHLNDQELISTGKMNENIAKMLFDKGNIIQKYVELIGA